MLRTHFACMFEPQTTFKNKTRQNCFKTRLSTKYCVLGGTPVIVASVLPQREAQMANRSAQFRPRGCDYTRFRNVHAKELTPNPD